MKIRNNEKRIKKSCMMIGIFLIMLFATSISAFASSEVTGMKQTDASTDWIKIKWTGDESAKGYYVYYSTDKKTWIRSDNEDDEYPDVYRDKSNPTSYEEMITDLKAGKTYYVKVQTVYYNESSYNYYGGSYSDIFEVVTAPDTDLLKTIKQTKASSSSVTVKWTKVSGATGYYVYMNKYPYDSSYNLASPTKKVTTNSAKLSTSSGKESYVNIVPYRKSSSGYIAIDSYKSKYSICSVPSKPTKVASVDDGNLDWFPTESNKVTVGWNKKASDDSSTISGWQVQIYSLSGKKLKTYTTKSSTTYKSFNIKSVKNKGFKVRVRGFYKIGSKKYYGAWSSFKVVVPQPNTTIVRKSSTSIKVSWKKITGAKKYQIYLCKNVNAKNPKWKKVATVSKNKTSYTIKNLKSTSGVGVYVRATGVKCKGKKYNSTITYYNYFW